ncbi:MAG: sugar ABC transporter ATP-binding protein [Limisphaerales bacterium]
MTLRLALHGLEKSFGATRALRGVSFSVAAGEVHALIGENGAGKSTLMKILSGAHRPDAGRIELDGTAYEPRDPLAARRAGVVMIYQELTLAPHLSVEENILLGQEPHRFGWLDRARRRTLAHAALRELQHDTIPLGAPAGSRSIGEQQIIEIARALVSEPRVLILDEPTSSLAQGDVERLFAAIRRLSGRGVAVIYISHFLEECRRLCARFTVLRDGESVGSGPMAAADTAQLVRLMVGRVVAEIYPRTPRTIGGPVYELRGVSGRARPHGVSLKLRAGEVLGVAGLIGAGRTETLRAAFGLDRLAAGTVAVLGAEVRRPSPRDSLARGAGMVSEDRKAEGLLLQRSVADNLVLTRPGTVSRWGCVSGRRQREAARRWIERLGVRTRGPDQAVGELSGGNQQKVALARLLHHDARILLLDEPTRGIDVGSKAEIYKLIGALAAEGRGVLFVSSYLPELLGVCDTIAVMCRGRLTAVRPAAGWTEHEIMAAAVGQEEVAA